MTNYLFLYIFCHSFTNHFKNPSLPNPLFSSSYLFSPICSFLSTTLSSTMPLSLFPFIFLVTSLNLLGFLTFLSLSIFILKPTRSHLSSHLPLYFRCCSFLHSLVWKFSHEENLSYAFAVSLLPSVPCFSTPVLSLSGCLYGKITQAFLTWPSQCLPVGFFRSP